MVCGTVAALMSQTMERTTYHRDGTVTIWDVYAQSWTRTRHPSNAILASLDRRERKRVMRHCDIADDDDPGMSPYAAMVMGLRACDD